MSTLNEQGSQRNRTKTSTGRGMKRIIYYCHFGFLVQFAIFPLFFFLAPLFIIIINNMVHSSDLVSIRIDIQLRVAISFMRKFGMESNDIETGTSWIKEWQFPFKEMTKKKRSNCCQRTTILDLINNNFPSFRIRFRSRKECDKVNSNSN